MTLWIEISWQVKKRQPEKHGCQSVEDKVKRVEQNKIKPSVWKIGAVGVGIIGGLLWGACNHSKTTPHDALRAYVTALKQKDHGRAYSLLSQKLRRRCDQRQFVRNVKQAGAKAIKKLEKIARKPKKMKFSAAVDLDAGERILLVKNKGQWRIASDPFMFYDQSTPREALRSFVRALARKRYRILMRFAPRKWRQAMSIKDLRKLYAGENEEKTRQLIAKLRESLDNRIEINGNEAVMLYSENRRVVFIKEEGVWKISEFQ
jgi:hypothetical protein